MYIILKMKYVVKEEFNFSYGGNRNFDKMTYETKVAED
jgi:hypothetical protein